MRFKQFLEQQIEWGSLEDEEEEHRHFNPPWKLKAKKLTIDEMKAWIKEFAPSHYKNDKFIMRGMGKRSMNLDFSGVYDLSKMNRRAANTMNYYNLWIDNHPDWKEFPKRSKSFICTTDPSVADGYGKPYFIIPKDTTKIGVCPRSDIWYSFKAIVRLMDNQGMDSFMKLISIGLGLTGIAGNPERDWDLFVEMARACSTTMIEQALLNGDITNKEFSKMAAELVHYMNENNFDSLYEALDHLIDPKPFAVETGATFSDDNGSEVWMSGEVLAIEKEDFKKLWNDK